MPGFFNIKDEKMKIHCTKGMTLVEILVAAFVFTLAAGLLLSGIASLLYLIDISKEQTVAFSDLRSMIERIKAMPFDAIVFSFPNTVVDGPGGQSYQAIVGGYTLNNEHITVSYPNENADPLEIRATLTWQDKRAHPHNESVSTFKTR